jgi:hypothetical protein
MSAEKVTFALLKAYAPLLVVVPQARIFAGLIPLNTVLPAIAYNHISTTENTTVRLGANIETTRIQVTVASKDYTVLKNAIGLVKQAMNHKQGLIAGSKVNSVIQDITGPDFRDDDLGIYYQTVDFRISITL